MAADEGASPGELLLEAARRDNTSLLSSLLLQPSPTLSSHTSQPAGDAATLVNATTDASGASALHVAASAGSLEAMDMILDAEGVEVDPVQRMTGETPLHRAVAYAVRESEVHATTAGSTSAGNIDGAEQDKSTGQALVELLLDAGADPRLRDDLKQKPVDIIRQNKSGSSILDALRQALEQAEWTLRREEMAQNAGDAGPAGSAAAAAAAMGLDASDIAGEHAEGSDGPSDEE